MFSESKGGKGGGEKNKGEEKTCKWKYMGLQTIPSHKAVQKE